jgi:type IV pilus assembly protein PilE
MQAAQRCSSNRHTGFTLIEVMITVAIIGILSAIAIPSYVDYVLRGKVVEATTFLHTTRASMEQYFQDNRTYMDVVGTAASPCSAAMPAMKYFTPTCTFGPTTYTITATGNGGMPNFFYTINQRADMTSRVSANWDSANTVYDCWIVKRGGTC